jgi:hypothetical protein
MARSGTETLRFVVGVTGHRLNKIPVEAIARIEHQLSSVFSIVDAAVTRGLSEQSTDASDPISVRLVSGLAEGADQLAVAVRPKAWVVDAILPFPRGRYRRDFAPENATGGVDRRREFESALAQAQTIVELPDDSDAPRAYQRAGECLLQKCDLLVAVWDGEPRVGPGGTEAIVSSSMAAQVPVVWIHSDRDLAPALVLALGQSAAEPTTAPATRKVLEDVVAGILKRRFVEPNRQAQQDCAKTTGGTTDTDGIQSSSAEET